MSSTSLGTPAVPPPTSAPPWKNAWDEALYGAGGFFRREAPAAHFRTSVHASPLFARALVRLVREPDNVHDGNAVAVYAERATSKAGYVPKMQARRLAPLLDAGVELVAVSTRGAGRGTEGTVPQILVCERSLFDHLTRS